MIKTSETYIDYWKDGAYVQVNVQKAPSPGVQFDQIGSVEIPSELKAWTNKETYSAFLRWAADRIDEVPYNRPTDKDNKR